MNSVVENTPYIALVDDDAHSTRLLVETLMVHGSVPIKTFAGTSEEAARLIAAFAPDAQGWPTMVIVDLKTHSGANLEFVGALAPLTAKFDVPVVVMAQLLERSLKAALYEAGAAAVFVRHADLEAYRREAANIVSFWARSQRLDAVGM